MTKKRILILTTTRDFLGKFEQGNVKILQEKGFEVHYAANMEEPHYPADEERLRALGFPSPVRRLWLPTMKRRCGRSCS